jgi:hypothetical protein
MSTGRIITSMSFVCVVVMVVCGSCSSSVLRQCSHSARWFILLEAHTLATLYVLPRGDGWSLNPYMNSHNNKDWKDSV